MNMESDRWRKRSVRRLIRSAACALVVVVAMAASAVLSAAIGEHEPSAADAGYAPFVGSAPASDQSAISGLLRRRSFESMTVAELARVRDEVQRTYSDADFRATSDGALTVDIFRRNGRTVAAGVYVARACVAGEAHCVGGTRLRRSIGFFCSDVDGLERAYPAAAPLVATERTPISPLIADGFGPFDRAVSIAWSRDEGIRDLGFRDIRARRTHGVAGRRIGYKPGASAFETPVEIWIDVEDARVLRVDGYTLDWRRPRAPEWPGDQAAPPCMAQLYRTYSPADAPRSVRPASEPIRSTE
jgi:hypothetical protein